MGTYADYLADLKREAKISGTNIDLFILDRTNESLRNFARLQNYQELLVLDRELTLALAAPSTSLPQDFLRLGDEGHIYFVQDSNTIWELYDQIRPVVNLNDYPRYFRIAGGVINIRPYKSVVATNTIRITYYKYPAAITDAAEDDFPVLALRDAVFQDVLSRIALFQDSKQYQARTAEKKQKFVESVGGK